MVHNFPSYYGSFLLANDYIHTRTTVGVVQVQVKIVEIYISTNKEKTFFLYLKSFYICSSERIKYQRKQL